MQKQLQSHVEISVQAQQIAESQRMGELLAAYPRSYKVYPKGIAIGVVFLVAIPTIALPFAGLPWTFYLLSLALLGIVVYLLQKRAGKVHRHDQLILYRAGFVYFNGKKIKLYRWENIKHIIRGTAAIGGDIDVITVAYTPKGSFELLNRWEKHARAAICDTIESNFVETRLPQVIEQYNAGAEIEFSTLPKGLRASAAGFRESDDLLPWSMVEKAEVGSEFVIIRKEGRTSDWYHALVSTVPNAALLKALLDYRQYNC